MTETTEPVPARTVVLLAEPGAGRARRLAVALEALGVRPGEPDDEVGDGEADTEDAVQAIDDIGGLHERILDAAVVRADDARPQAWSYVSAAVSSEQETMLVDWLRRRLDRSDPLLATDRRLHWLLPLWLRACREADARAVVVVAVRRPDLSAESQVGAPADGRPGDVSRAAAWLNQVLFVERATRELPVVIARVDEVAQDWVVATARIGDALELGAIRDASATIIRNAQLALDQVPGTAVEPTERVALPARLAALVDQTWELLERAAGGAGDPGLHAAFDEVRAAYVAYYSESESVARSSLRAARARRPARETPPAAAAVPPPAKPAGSWLPWRRHERPQGA